MREIEKLRGHVIVCGFGRFGRVVADELLKAGREVVVIESQDALDPDIEASGAHPVISSATSDHVLTKAGVAVAKSLVVAASDEADGVFITLSARELSPGLRIYARGETEAAIRRLERAGADHVTSPYQMGGVRTATSILRPSVVDFLELSRPTERSQEIDLEEAEAGRGSVVVGRSISEIEADASKLRIVALKRPESPIERVPDASLEVKAGDSLVVIGERDQLARLAQQALAVDVDA